MKIFQNLFKPKWKNKDPEIRKQALINLDKHENQDVFIDVAKNDPLSEIRQLAVKRIFDLDIVNDIALSDSDSKVRELANKILCQMLSGEIEGNINKEQRLEKVKLLENQTVLEHIAQKGETAALRMCAIEKVTRESLLGNLAINDDDAQIRFTAANKLTQKSTLERVFRSTKTKDKVVSRVTRQKLDEIIAEEEKPARLLDQQKQLCLSMESLGSKGLWERDKKQFDLLSQQWQNLASDTSAEFDKRFSNAKSKFTQSYDDYLERHAERLKQEAALLPIKEKKQALITQLHDQFEKLNQDSELTEADIRTIKTDIELQSSNWQNIGQLPTDIESELSNQFQDISASLNKLLNSKLKTINSLGSLNKLLKDLDHTIKNPKKFTEKSLQNIEKKLSSIVVDASMENVSKLRLTLKNRLEEARQLFSERQKNAEKQYEKSLQLLDKLDTALNNGILKEAIDLKKSIQSNIQQLEKAQHKDLLTIKNRLTAANNRVNELNNWRSWANTPQKEQLIKKVEALIGSDEDPKEIAFIISQARKTWKNLGSSEKESSQLLWDKFQEVCDKAFEPCKSFFEEDAQLKQENYEKRKSFLNDLETFIANANWESVDWKKIENLFRHLKQEWQALGHTEANHRKALNKQFYSLHDALKKHLHEEWNKNLAAKQELVEQAKQLESVEDLKEAINQAKSIQSAWKKAGRITQAKERELWKALKTECDKVFSRKQNAIKQQEDELADKISAKEKSCAAIEDLCKKPLKEFEAEKSQLHSLQQKFNEIGQTNKNTDDKLKQRIAEALHIYERKLESLEKLQTLEALKQLRIKAEILDKWEAELENGNQTDADAYLQAFNASDKIAHADWQEKLTQRLNETQLISQADDASSMMKEKAAAVFDDKNLSTIHLEIIANIDTPQEAAEDRLKLQAQRLSEKLQNHEEENQWESFLTTEAKWLTTGPIEKTKLDKLASRRLRAIEALKNEYPEELSDYI